MSMTFLRSTARSWGGYVLVLLIGTVMAPLFVQTMNQWIQVARVESNSMMPTLKKGDRVMLVKRVSDIHRGHIMAYRAAWTDGKIYIKRVVGLPKEIVEIKDGSVYANGIALPFGTLSVSESLGPEQMPDTGYFLIGDRSEISYDSRMFHYDPSVSRQIMKQHFLGRAIAIVWPLYRIKILE